MIDIVELIQDNLFEVGVTVAFIVIVMPLVFAWSRRRMADMTSAWESAAASHGLQYASNPVTYDYGEFGGEQSWDFPGMVGKYRGREVRVQTMSGSKGREAGRMILLASVQLAQNVPFGGITYKRRFNEAVRDRIPHNMKSNNKAFDKAFDIRTDNMDFIVNVSQKIDLLAGIKAQKLRTAQLLFDGNQLIFEGAASGYSASPEQAITLLDWLCEIADKAD